MDILTFHEQMQELMDEMARAYRTGDAHYCAQLFTLGGVLYSPYARPARGRTEIESLHRLWTVEETGKQLTVKAASSSGNLGWCLVAYSEGDGTGDGTSLNVVELQPGGKWLIRVCSIRADAPPLLE